MTVAHWILLLVCCLQQAVKGKTGRKERESGGEAAILAVAVSTGSQLPASIRSSPPPADHPPTTRLPGGAQENNSSRILRTVAQYWNLAVHMVARCP